MAKVNKEMTITTADEKAALIETLIAAKAGASVAGVTWELDVMDDRIVLSAVYDSSLGYTDEPWDALELAGAPEPSSEGIVAHEGESGLVCSWIQYDIDIDDDEDGDDLDQADEAGRLRLVC